MNRTRWSRHLGALRVRATVPAVGIVAVALIAASVVLVVVLRRSQVDEVRSAATLRAADVVERLQTGTDPGDLDLEEGEDRFVQIVARGAVVAASSSAADVDPLSGRSGTRVRVPVGDADDRWVVVEVPAGEGRTVVVGRESDPASESVATAAWSLVLGVPALLAVVGFTTWRVVGRSLAPVDAMRREVESISATDLDRRVPEPDADDEVGELARTMNEMLGRLQAAQFRQQRFVSDASHELRSPVASIRQHAEVASEHPDHTSVAELAEVVLAEDLRMQRLVEDLLVLARADEGALGASRREVDLDDLALAEARRLREVNGLSVDTSGIGAGRIVGDERLVRRAVRNVVDNAARHASSLVRVGVTTEDGTVVVVVDDDGPGIPPQERERVLERFVRLDDARDRDAGGAGLGLAIVAEVAGAHGGAVTVDGSDLGGARITVCLPTGGTR